MTSYRMGLEDGLLLAALVLEDNPEIRTPSGWFAASSLRLASERLRVQRLAPLAASFASLHSLPPSNPHP